MWKTTVPISSWKFRMVLNEIWCGTMVTLNLSANAVNGAKGGIGAAYAASLIRQFNNEIPYGLGTATKGTVPSP